MRQRGIGGLAAGALVAACLAGGSGIPASVHRAAAAHGCTPLGTSPEPADAIDAWFVDLSPHTGKSGDVALLCRARSAERRLLLVVSASSPESPWRGCASAVPLTRAFDPQGLAVLRAGESYDFTRMPLDRWSDEGGQPGPSGVAPQAPILDTSGGIAGWAFTCHEGRWLKVFIH